MVSHKKKTKVEREREREREAEVEHEGDGDDGDMKRAYFKSTWTCRKQKREQLGKMYYHGTEKEQEMFLYLLTWLLLPESLLLDVT